ncbi:hypothetical protein CHS0354_008019 [Potamilus streckersoni]|uniref:Uncharacterized protein n=1 Tax=Potamilus streckersoni TaxID=2493646 RepID=A0AAE0T1M4_9BIVA|nr:hypothetical protein CHS0354_008019 [Potamilus streckersoni]
MIKTNLIGMGISGWMADFGEYLPASGVKFYDNQSGEVLHNKWPVLWAKLNREAVEESGKLGDIVFWMRAGFSESASIDMTDNISK